MTQFPRDLSVSSLEARIREVEDMISYLDAKRLTLGLWLVQAKIQEAAWEKTKASIENMNIQNKEMNENRTL